MTGDPTQAYGVLALIVALTLVAAGLAGGGVLLIVVGVAALAGSALILRRSRSFSEHEE